MLIRKRQVWALLLMIGIPIHLSATTVVLMVSPLGIVIATDSKYVSNVGSGLKTGEGITDKVTIVQNHFAVASLGQADIRSGLVHYNFLQWIKDIQTRLRRDVSVDELASIVETESVNEFGTFDSVLERGLIVQKVPFENCESFIQYVIAGFQDNQPRIYTITFDIDWNHKKLIGPKKTRLLIDMPLYFFGAKEALLNLTNPDSFAYKQAMIDTPKEFRAFLAGPATDLNEYIVLSRILVGIEEKTNPNEVGGDIRLIKILPNGVAERIPDKALPKTSATEQNQKKNH
jgi:hypothetical protein